MASTPLELLIVVCSVCVFVAYGVVFARSLWRTNYRIDDAGVKLVAWLSESCWACRRIQPFGEFEQFVLRRLEGQRVERAKFLLNTAGTLCVLVLVILLVRNLRDKPQPMSSCQILLLIAFAGGALLAKVVPACIEADRFGILYSVYMLGASVWLARTRQSHDFVVFATAACWPVCFVFSLAYQVRLPVVACWQLVYVAVSVYSYRKVPDQSCGAVSIDMFASLSVIFSVVLVVGTSAAAHTSRVSASHEIRKTMLQDSSSAMSMLLDLVCDVSFELDADLRLKEDAPKFSAMVTLGSRASTKNLPFTSCMPLDDDKELFERRLREQPTGIGSGSIAGLQHLTLRDSLGNHIATEVFHVWYEYMGAESFLIGLRESGEHSIAELKSFSKQRPRRKNRLHHLAPVSPSAAADVDSSPKGAATVKAQFPSGHHHHAPGAPPADADGDPSATGITEVNFMSVAEIFSNRSSLSDSQFAVSDERSTDTQAMSRSVLRAMKGWSLPQQRRTRCCNFHGAVEQLERVALFFQDTDCQPGFGPSGNEQCKWCRTWGSPGADEQEWLCSICRGPNLLQSAWTSESGSEHHAKNVQSL